MGKPTIRNGRATSIPLGLFFGAVTSILLTILCSVVAAYFIHAGKMNFNSIGYIVMINLSVSTLVGCIIAVTCIQRLKLLISMASGLIYAVLLLMINALFLGGYYQGVTVTLLLIMGSAAAIGLISGNPKNKRNTGSKRRFVKMYKKLSE